MTTKKEKALQATPATPVQRVVTPMDLIVQGQDQGLSIEQMQQLFELQLRYDENESKKAFHKAFAAFKAESIDIIKKKTVSFATNKGKTEYNHAELGQIMLTVIPFLSQHGLSHNWEYEQPEGQVKVTCVLTHELGFSKRVSLQSGKDDSGGKNTIQAIGSATSYLERYTFLAVTGLASREQDADGAGSEQPTVEVITEWQWADLDAMIDQTKTNRDQFCSFYKINDIAMLPAMKYKQAMSGLEAKAVK